MLDRLKTGLGKVQCEVCTWPKVENELVVLKGLGNEVEKLDMCEHENDESSELLKTDGESNMESKEVNKSVNFEATENFRDVLEMADTEESEEL